MFEEKLNISFPELENEEIKFLGNKITVIPYFTVGNKSYFIKEYLENLFGNVYDDLSSRYFLAEYSLIFQIIDKNTNIEIENFDVDKAITAGLWNLIKEKIVSYPQFREELQKVIDYYQQEMLLEKSVGNIIEQVSGKIVDFLNNLSDMDAAIIKDASDNFTKELKKLNEKIPGVTESK